MHCGERQVGLSLPPKKWIFCPAVDSPLPLHVVSEEGEGLTKCQRGSKLRKSTPRPPTRQVQLGFKHSVLHSRLQWHFPSGSSTTAEYTHRWWWACQWTGYIGLVRWPEGRAIYTSGSWGWSKISLLFTPVFLSFFPLPSFLLLPFFSLVLVTGLRIINTLWSPEEWKAFSPISYLNVV